MNFDGVHPFTTLFFCGACCKQGRHLYTATAPLFCIPASYCHLSATLETLSITVVNVTRQSSCVSNFYRTFKVFIWLFPIYVPCACKNIILSIKIFFLTFWIFILKFEFNSVCQWETLKNLNMKVPENVTVLFAESIRWENIFFSLIGRTQRLKYFV
jgi:hypothetical protein